MADAAVGRAIERLGNQARRAIAASLAERTRALRASGRTPTVPEWATQLQKVPAAHVCRLAGRDVVTAALTVDDADLIRADLADFADQWRTHVGAAADEVVSLISATLPDAHPGQEAVLATRVAYGESIDTSATFVTDLLTQDSLAALFDDVELDAAQLGEIDQALRVTPDSLRRALAVAGGADPAAVAVGEITGEDIGGLTGGRHALRAADAAGLTLVGYRWVYGAAFRQTPFEPHKALDGMVFVDWEDPKLLTSGPGAWVGAFYHPGDHSFCVCDAEPVYGPRATGTEPEPPPEPPRRITGPVLEGDAAEAALADVAASPWDDALAGASRPPLTAEQADSLDLYGGARFEDINGAFRQGTHLALDPENARIVADMDSLMMPTPAAVVTHRGVADAGKVFGVTDGNFDALVGHTYVDPGFQSTSILAEKAEGSFARGGAVMHIDVPAGHPSIWLGAGTSERELILARGTVYDVVDHEVRGGVHHFTMVARSPLIVEVP